jgi:hypothetical protein
MRYPARQDGDLVGGGQGLVLVVVTSTVVVPVARRTARTSVRTVTRRPAPREAKGSSSRIRLGWLARARASATRCC